MPFSVGLNVAAAFHFEVDDVLLSEILFGSVILKLLLKKSEKCQLNTFPTDFTI